jgi:hypothetical protein
MVSGNTVSEIMYWDVEYSLEKSSVAGGMFEAYLECAVEKLIKYLSTM